MINHRIKEIEGTLRLVDERHKAARLVGDVILAQHYINIGTALMGLKAEIDRREYARAMSAYEKAKEPEPPIEYNDYVEQLTHYMNETR